MKRVLRLFILVLALAFGLSQIQAQELSSNSVSSDATMVQITIPGGPATAAPQSAVALGEYQARPESTYTLQKSTGDKSACNVLMVVADGDISGSPIQGLLQAYGDLGAVDLFDAINGTPTLGQIQAYDVVITWSNNPYNDDVSLGNVLADYVDAGGKVINLMFSMGVPGGYQLLGRFQTENYAAINASSYIFSTSCLGTYTSGHPIMAGVSNVCDYYRPVGTSLGIESTEVARWADGELFVAVKNNHTVISIGGYVGAYYQWTGQMPDVLHNAILYLYTPPVIPVSNWGIFLSIFLFISFAAFSIKKFF